MTNLKVIPKATEIPNTDELHVGEWYWVEESDNHWLGCIVYLGSNYAKLEGVDHSMRVHFHEFLATCTRELDPQSIIAHEVSSKKANLHRLMAEIQEVTARLGVDSSAPSSDTQALATTGRELGAYTKALTRAKQTLPKLFEEIKEVHIRLAKWMKAEAIPLQAQTRGMEHALKKIDARIFSVELYAGLTENIITVVEGEPAPRDAKLHLMQRMHFMDEECLLNYKAGGMTFQNLEAFDQWLKKKKNRDRLLPFPRCCIAFRVRRHNKPNAIGNFQDFIRFMFGNEKKENQSTFLYIRNGEQLYCLQTKIDFGETLFPNTNRSVFGAENLLAKKRYSEWSIISVREHEAMVAEDRLRLEHWHKEKIQKKRDHVLEVAAWEKLSKNERASRSKPYYFEPCRPDLLAEDYKPFDPSNVYYDDITEHLNQDIQHYNRIGLLLQGLFDRSPVLHPHPKAKLWTPEGFDAAVKLIYDKDYALVSGPKPDFEAYRQRLNASMKVGSVVVGQQYAWMLHMAETHKDAPDYANVFKPYGNPGPGTLARVAKFGKRSGKATFQWLKDRSWRGEDAWRREYGWGVDVPGVSTSWSCSSKLLLNVDAYTPGDYKQFFQDPRTRAEYLKWAPLLLAAEDYHAGKRDVNGKVK